MHKIVFALALSALGCTGGSPLVDSGPQVEVTSNPGGVAGRPSFQLSLTAWVHLSELGDAAESGQLEATLDGAALALAPVGTGYFGNGDSYTAMFVLPPTGPATARATDPTTSTVTVTDQQTTWSVQIPGLFTNDLQPVGPIITNQASTVVWPSAATTEPWSTIDFACIEIEHRAAACHGATTHDPGIDVTEEYVQIDMPANPGDRFTLWGQRWFHPQASGNGPVFFTTILDQVAGTFE
jgi:hypothetical protein